MKTQRSSHTMRLETENLFISKGGADFHISDTEKGAIGTLCLTSTRIEWFPKGKSAHKASFRWEEFDALMAEHVK